MFLKIFGQFINGSTESIYCLDVIFDSRSASIFFGSSPLNPVKKNFSGASEISTVMPTPNPQKMLSFPSVLFSHFSLHVGSSLDLFTDMCSLNDDVIEESVIEEEAETPADHVIDTCRATLDSLELNYFYNPEYAQDIVEYLMVSTSGSLSMHRTY